MKRSTFLDALGDVRDEYVAAAAPGKKIKRRAKARILTALLAAALIVGAVSAVFFFALKPSQNDPPAVLPTTETTGTGDPSVPDAQTDVPVPTVPSEGSGEVTPTAVTPDPLSPPTVTTDPSTPTTETPRVYECPPVYAVSHEHEWVTEKPVKATCTLPGRTEGRYCAICSDVDVYPERIEPLGEEHRFENGVCTLCGERKPNEGYEFALSADGSSYEIVSAKNVTDCYFRREEDRSLTPVSPFEANVLIYVIPESFGGLPVSAIRATDFCPDYGMSDTLHQRIGYPETHFYIGDNILYIDSRSITVRNLTSPHVHVHDLISWCAINRQQNEDAFTHSDEVFFDGRFLGDKGSTLYLGDELLTDVVLPLHTKAIGRHSFSNNRVVRSVTMPSYIERIYDGAFVGCSALETYRFSWRVSQIGSHAFENSGIREIAVPEGVTELRYASFAGCRSLERVTLPSTLKTICDSAFSRCRIPDLTIPEGVQTIDLFAFSDAEIGQLRLPSTLRKIGDYAFSRRIGKLYAPDLASYLSCDFPAEGSPTVLADEICFDGEPYTGKLTIPSSASHLGSHALRFGSPIGELIFPASIKTVGEDLFGRYTNYGYNAVEILRIESLPALLEIDYTPGSSPLGVSKEIYVGSDPLGTVLTVPECRTLGSCALAFSRFDRIVLPSSLGAIGDNAFYSCRELRSIDLPDGIATVGERAFGDCVKLTSVALPDSVTSIGKEAFSGCTSLVSAILPDCPCGSGLFAGCSAISDLSSISIYETIYERMFSSCAGLRSVTVPGSVNRIEDAAFENCGNLGALLFEERNGKELSLGENAFAFTAFTSVDILPNTEVSGYCFFGSALEEIWVYEGAILTENWSYIGVKTPRIHEPGAWTVVNGARVDLVLPVDPEEIFTFSPNETGYTAVVRADYNGADVIMPDEYLGVPVTGIDFSRCKRTSFRHLRLSENLRPVVNYFVHPDFETVEISKNNPYYFTRGNCLVNRAGTLLLICSKGVIPLDGSVRSIHERAFCSVKPERIILNDAIHVSSIIDQRNCTTLCFTTATRPAFVSDAFVKLFGENVVYGYDVHTEYGLPVSGSVAGFIFFEAEDGNGYVLIGSGDLEGVDLIIPSVHNGKAVTAIASGAVAGRSFRTLFLPASVSFVSPDAFPFCTFESIEVESGNPTYRSVGSSLIDVRERALVIGTAQTVIPDDGSVTTLLRGAFNGRPCPNELFLPASVKTVMPFSLRIRGSAGKHRIYTPLPASDFDALTASEFGQTPSNTVVVYEAHFHYEDGKPVFDGGEIDYVFEETENGYILTQASGTAKELTLPSSYRGKPVTAIGPEALRTVIDLQKLTVPEGYLAIGKSSMPSTLCEILLPQSLISIGERAFYGTAITSIALPSSLTSIEAGAFSFTPLTSVALPQALEELKENAFANCASLKTATFKDRLTRIGNEAFSHCVSLESVTFPAELRSIGDYAFEHTALRNVVLPAALEQLGKGAFSATRTLERADLSATKLVSVSSDAFHESTLKTVLLPESLRTVEPNAFSMSGLTSFNANEALEQIGVQAFYHCSLLTEVTLSDNTLEIALSAFESCGAISGNDADGGVYLGGPSAPHYFLVRYKGASGMIPDGVRLVGNEAFRYSKSADTIILPEGVTDIGANAFVGAENLATVVLPSSLVTLGKNAFSNVTSLKEVRFAGNGPESLPSQCFSGCTALKTVVLPQGLTALEDRVFENCRSLASLTLPGSLKKLGSFAFYGCKALTGITVPASVRLYGSELFSGCTSLKTVYVERSAQKSMIEKNLGYGTNASVAVAVAEDP